MRAAPRRVRDAGESLLELLVSITLLGVAVASVIPAVFLAVGASSMDRRSVQAQSLVKSWAEFVVARTTDANYVFCATPATYTPASGSSVWRYQSPLPALPAGMTATVTQVQYWNGTSFVTGSCTAGTTDTGLQRVALRISDGGTFLPAAPATYWVAVRKPCVAC